MSDWLYKEHVKDWDDYQWLISYNFEEYPKGHPFFHWMLYFLDALEVFDGLDYTMDESSEVVYLMFNTEKDADEFIRRTNIILQKVLNKDELTWRVED